MKIRKRSYKVWCAVCKKERRITGRMTIAEMLDDQNHYVCSDCTGPGIPCSNMKEFDDIMFGGK